MRILLLAMPDAANNLHRIMRVPNLGLCSIAAHLSEHEVKIADLVLVHKYIRLWLKGLLEEFNVVLRRLYFEAPNAQGNMKLLQIPPGYGLKTSAV